MAPLPTQARRSSRQGRGSNGRDVQLDKLGELLTAPTRQAKKRFAPSDGLSLPNNVLAPVQKKRRRKKFQATLPPPTASQPCEQPLPNIDPRLGFFPTQSSTHSLPISHPETPAQPPRISSPHVTQHSTPHLSIAALSTHPSRAPTPMSNDDFGYNSTEGAAQPPRTPLPHVTQHSSPHLSIAALSTHPSRAPTPTLNNNFGHNSTESDEDDSDADVGQDDDLDIDEASDGEDDRAAHELLRAAPTTTHILADGPPAILPYGHSGFAVFMINELGNDSSVLQAHYARNRTPKAPNPSRVRRTPSVTLPPSFQLEQEGSGTAPRTLGSYPSQWQDVINYAKRSFRAYVAGENGFPDPLTGVEEARECLDDALAVHLEDGGVVEPGHEINKEMIMLVYAESWLLRSQLKADIRTQVRNLKSLFPDRFTGSAQQLQSKIKATIETWVADGSYLHDSTPGSDDQIHFSHPVIASTTKLFYFDKWREISTHNPDTFKGAVPKPLVALIGAVYRNTLDEWANGYPLTVKLERKPYKEVYDEILLAMATVEDDPIDGPLLKERLAAWAGFGTSMNSHPNAASRISTAISLKLSSRQ
ncbi:hypothetical protein BJ322DRAFT_1020281 [Thelephora terrestris]|uniref:DUF6532 domain-containing protein n=1 Tax=Thelephora terrestris TaxID=56493 RepID=A0A9P6L813_9AGAM|nr:hypothetical protein BJ322DRAFT_1020281 [Thelephora terrestris]